MISTVALLTAVAGPALADRHEKTVFVTKVSFNGNLGGLTGADDKCQADADDPTSIVPSGTYMAWLSDGIESPDTRFSKSQGPYVLPNGTKIADNYSNLTDGSIPHAINVDATGKLLGFTYYWTGTNANGTSAQYFQTCDGWTANAKSKGMAGSHRRGPTLWSSYYAGMKCSITNKIACFQQ